MLTRIIIFRPIRKMKEIVSNFFRTVTALVTVVAGILYLCTILLPYVDTGKYWYLSFVGLGFLILFFTLLFLLIFWLTIRSKWWIVCGVILLLGYRQIDAAFAFHLPSKFEMVKGDDVLRVMQWNVHSWNQSTYPSEHRFDTKALPKMMALIEEYNPDVLCMEEFFESENRRKWPSNIATLKKMEYKYFFFLNPGRVDDHYEGVAIFSKLPILESGEVQVSVNSDADPLAYADVQFAGQRVRVIAVHLQSVKFDDKQYQDLNDLRRGRKPDIRGGRTIFSKLKAGFQHRYDQALRVRRQAEQSSYPVVVCGDFNDVPNSGTYFTIAGNLQDAFLKKGTFIGRTFRFISPTLRIDYILPDNHFEVTQFKRIKSTYSDHYPLVADLTLHQK